MKTTFETLAQMLQSRGERSAERVALTFLDERGGEGSLAYGELDRRARAVAARLAEEAAPGDRVLLLYPPGLDFVAGLFGCLYAGIIAVPAFPPRGRAAIERLLGIWSASGARIALTTAQGRQMATTTGGPIAEMLRWISTDDLEIERGELWRETAVTPATVAMLQFTSGSTSRPKGVVLTHENLLANIAIIHQSFRMTQSSFGVNWLPPYHDMGLIGTILAPLYAGFPTALMAPWSFVQRPLRWLQAIAQHRATICGGPNFAFQLCVDRVAEEQRAGLDLSSWSVAFCGAETISAPVLARFAAAYAPYGFRPEALYPCYGLAESTLFVTGGEAETGVAQVVVDPAALERGTVRVGDDSSATGRPIVDCGRPWGDSRVVIVDPETAIACPPERVGEIWVSGASVAAGYWESPEETRQTFQARLADTGEGPFLRTGDLGFVRDGELFVTGRLKDLIILDGRNLYPQDIERTAEGCDPRLSPGCSAVFSVLDEDGERIVLVQEVGEIEGDGLAELAENLQRGVAASHDVPLHAVVLIRARTLPKTSSGKIARHACRTAYLGAGLDALAIWSAGELQPRGEG